MRANPLRKNLQKYLVRHGLSRKFEKQLNHFLVDSTYPSLNTEKMKIGHIDIYSFRIDRKYRVIFTYNSDESIEIIDINNHYQ